MRLQFVRAGTSVPIGASITDEELSAAVETRSAGGETVVVASLVSRHFDFLDGLVSGTLQKDGRALAPVPSPRRFTPLDGHLYDFYDFICKCE